MTSKKRVLVLTLLTVCLSGCGLLKGPSKEREDQPTERLSKSESSSNNEKNRTNNTDSSPKETLADKGDASSGANLEAGNRESSTDAASEVRLKNHATSAQYNGSYYTVEGKYGPVLIVNKKHPLNPSYGYGEDATAFSAFQQLLSAMKSQGFAVSDSYSGFRSYDTQAGLYQSYAARDGAAAADRYSARPGYSEHQTGLAFDLMDSSGALLEEPMASQWLRDHAHEYGFIVRYLPGKEAITGYTAESWHIRYIGPEATDIHQSGLTLEEYFGIPGGDY
ncbi:LD-carboxypeptidase LdcB/DacB [Streptococcus ovuberis]|uniref:M15 family metallopeptidase n=1 Tax=Streptococcus ovuberis TaxID=1936207 RepID=A0A7X6MWP7_9STRE|nr:LD-carboxypeptidase LdcB/DacB [Streptococcus ovuberis]NKZ19311.1 M15 family metallopeptidase [Streptococcus ovuberis]